ncbi:hypothetical protein HMN09_00726800 [Mycena chlorophos]|uniref:Secreted protein n=1 Tax=Mycena chlorophos TaxID=658473 RepID=A0A8H6SUP9_MYCCL|nr:hypothetical protein HMN09_00726800 [Mycena chlorophos]
MLLVVFVLLCINAYRSSAARRCRTPAVSPQPPRSTNVASYVALDRTTNPVPSSAAILCVDVAKIDVQARNLRRTTFLPSSPEITMVQPRMLALSAPSLPARSCARGMHNAKKMPVGCRPYLVYAHNTYPGPTLAAHWQPSLSIVRESTQSSAELPSPPPRRMPLLAVVILQEALGHVTDLHSNLCAVGATPAFSRDRLHPAWLARRTILSAGPLSCQSSLLKICVVVRLFWRGDAKLNVHWESRWRDASGPQGCASCVGRTSPETGECVMRVFGAFT